MIEVSVHHPAELDWDKWRQLQSIQRDAFGSVLNRSQTEIDALVDWQDPNRYFTSHIDPNTEVGKRFNDHQSFTQPRVALATDGDETVGFAYSAYNVSGKTQAIQTLKRLNVAKNYLWIREMAVKPDHQRLGIAQAMGRALLKESVDEQPVTAYIWPDEISFLGDAVEWFWFLPTSEQQVKVFGDDTEPIKQVRYQAFAGDIRSALADCKIGFNKGL
jgi:GNAT superfamily N-acetyltransferase